MTGKIANLVRISHQPRRGARLWPTAQAVGPQTAMEGSSGGATDVLLRQAVPLHSFAPTGACKRKRFVPRADALGQNLSRLRRCAAGEKCELEPEHPLGVRVEDPFLDVVRKTEFAPFAQEALIRDARIIAPEHNLVLEPPSHVGF